MFITIHIYIYVYIYIYIYVYPERVLTYIYIHTRMYVICIHMNIFSTHFLFAGAVSAPDVKSEG